MITEKKIKQYIVVSSCYIETLEDEVNGRIKEGWIPIGGVSIGANGCTQAMIPGTIWEHRVEWAHGVSETNETLAFMGLEGYELAGPLLASTDGTFLLSFKRPMPGRVKQR